MFFQTHKGLLLVVEGLSQEIMDAKIIGYLKGIKICNFALLTHLLFIDDIFLVSYGLKREAMKIKDLLSIHYKATCMEVNIHKSTINFNGSSEESVEVLKVHFPFKHFGIQEVFKYFCFILKPNGYRKGDWGRLLGKILKRIHFWCNK
jgi:hypothetical protein